MMPCGHAEPVAGRRLAGDPDRSDRIIEPPAAVRVETLSAAGLTIKVLGKVRAGEQWTVTGELRRRLLTAFEENGIHFPNRGVVETAEG
jgi:small conductance mechanosensitive channel